MVAKVELEEAQPGDLVLWIGGMNSGTGNHVALYRGNGVIVHANGTLVTTDALAGRSPGWFIRRLV